MVQNWEGDEEGGGGGEGSVVTWLPTSQCISSYAWERRVNVESGSMYDQADIESKFCWVARQGKTHDHAAADFVYFVLVDVINVCS